MVQNWYEYFQNIAALQDKIQEFLKINFLITKGNRENYIVPYYNRTFSRKTLKAPDGNVLFSLNSANKFVREDCLIIS